MNKGFGYYLIILAALAMGCSKKIAAPIDTTPKTVLNIEEIDFEYFEGKARMVLRDANKERDVKAAIRIRKDSVIWMNFTVIGFQGGRALINKDSITIISNVDKEYFVFDYKELSKRFKVNITYDIIQAAMLGNPIIKRTEKDEVVKEPSAYFLKQETDNIDVVNYVNAASMKIEKVEMKEEGTSNSLVINYSNFQPVGAKVFPYNGTINLFYQAAAGLLNTSIIFEYSKAEAKDRELRFPFKIPNRYDRR